MKKIKLLSLILALVLLVLGLASCGDAGGGFPELDLPFMKKTVTFMVDGDVWTSKDYSTGQRITRPNDPERIYYTFAGWYTAEEGGELWDFYSDTMGEEDFKLYARWNYVGDIYEAEITEFGDFVKTGDEYVYTTDQSIYIINLSLHLTTSFKSTITVTTRDGVFDSLWKVPVEYGRNEIDVTVKSWSGTKQNEYKLVVNVIPKFQITFRTGDSPVKENIEYGKPIVPPSDFAVKNHELLGWSEDGKTPFNFTGAIAERNITFTPLLRRTAYSVVFDYGEGVTEEKTYSLDERPVYIDVEDREGYVFRGWLLEDGTAYNFDYAFNEEVTLTASYDVYGTISCYEDLSKLEGSSMTFKLLCNVNCYNEQLPKISEFSGVLEGDGYEIYAFSIDTTVKESAFIKTNNGTIRNLSLRRASVQYASGVSNANVSVLTCNNNGLIENCHIKDATLKGTKNGDRHTMITSFFVAENFGTVRGCTLTGSSVELIAIGNNYDSSYNHGGTVAFGSFAGLNLGTVEDCDATVTVSLQTGAAGERYNDVNYDFIGGAVGCVKKDGALRNSYAKIDVALAANSGWTTQVYVYVGSLAGCVDGIIEGCRGEYTYAASKVNYGCQRMHLGGAVGYISEGAEAKNCFAVGDMTLEESCAHVTDAGGFVGKNYGAVRNCYAISSIHSSLAADTGIFVGENTDAGTVRGCFATGDICTVAGETVNIFAEKNFGTVSDCYFDTASLKTDFDRINYPVTDPNATAISLTELLSLDFISENLFWDERTWELSAGNMPTLVSHPHDAPIAYENVSAYGTATVQGNVVTAVANEGYSFYGWYVGGTLVSEDISYDATGKSVIMARFEPTVIEISTYEHLVLLSQYPQADRSFTLTADVDCGGKALPSVQSFFGTLDGAGYVIYNFINTAEGDFALIINNAGTVKNLTLSGTVTSSVTSDAEIAFIAATNTGTITGCHATGELRLVTEKKGQNATVGADFTLGGICAVNEGTVSSSSTASLNQRAASYLSLVIDVECFMYSYDNANEYTTSVTLYAGFISGVNNGKIMNCNNGNSTAGTPTAPVSIRNNVIAVGENVGVFGGKVAVGDVYYSIGGITGVNGVKGEISGATDTSTIIVLQQDGTDIHKKAQGALVWGSEEVYLRTDAHLGGITGVNCGKVSTSSALGLISYASDNVANLGYDGGGIFDGLKSYVGGVVGRNMSGATVSNCAYQGLSAISTATDTYVGSIGGYNEGGVEYCYGNGLMLAEALNDDGRVYLSLRFWSGFGYRERAGSVAIGGIVGANADSARISNCLSDFSYEPFDYEGEKTSYIESAKLVIVNHVLVMKHIYDAFMDLLVSAPDSDKLLEVGTVVGTGEENHRGAILNCYYIQNGTYDYVDGTLLPSESMVGEVIGWDMSVWRIEDYSYTDKEGTVHEYSYLYLK